MPLLILQTSHAVSDLVGGVPRGLYGVLVRISYVMGPVVHPSPPTAIVVDGITSGVVAVAVCSPGVVVGATKIIVCESRSYHHGTNTDKACAMSWSYRS